jgi:hypothetical protein
MKNYLLWQNRTYLLIASLLSLLFLILNFYFWQNTIFGVLFLILWLSIISYWLGKILAKILPLEEWLRLFFGLLTIIIFISLGSALAIIVYKLVPVYIFFLLFIFNILFFILANKSKQEIFFKKEALSKSPESIKFYYILYFIFCLLYLLAFWFLLKSRTGNFIKSPWQVIHPLYLYFSTGIVFILSILIFLQNKLKKIFLLIILTSLLIHAYLPIVYQSGFGGDKWRHIGYERQIMAGRIVEPILIKTPRAILALNKISYSPTWGLICALSWLTKVDVFYLDLFFGWLFFSVFWPLLFYFISRQIFQDRRAALLLAITIFIFSPFQIFGSITLPLSFGFLYFIFVFIFLLEYLKQEKPSPLLKWLCFFGVFFSYFNYFIYFIFLFLLGCFFLLIKFLKRKKNFYPTGVLLVISFLLLVILLVPFLETVRGYSKFLGWQNFFRQLPKGFFDIFKRWLWLQPIFPESFYANQPSWFLKVDSGDFISRATVLKLAAWSVVIPLIVWIFIIYGLVRKNKPLLIKILAIFLVVVFFWQLIVNYYFYAGVRILTRRMNLIIGFFIAILFIWGLNCFLRNKNCLIDEKVRRYLGVFLISIIFMITYPSGPLLEMVTTNERQAAEFIWEEINSKFKIPNSKFCVLANTWPLLAVEEVSGRQIVGGGFPLYFEYQQPERVELFEKMNSLPSNEIMKKALEISGADFCYFMTEDRWTSREVINKIKNILGEPKIIGDVYIWQYKK